MGEDLARVTNPNALILGVAFLFGIAGASGKGVNFVETIIQTGRTHRELKAGADQFMLPAASTDVSPCTIEACQ
jgi:dTDP-4-dehydrorhamnose reductase